MHDDAYIFGCYVGKLLYGLKITIESNLKIVNYLDITLDLANGKYYPYRKHGNPPQYINAKSNHLPQIIKQFPASISERISRLSCDEAEFNKAATQHNEALKSSGFKTSLEYKSKSEITTPNKAKRRRNIIWFSPPLQPQCKNERGPHLPLSSQKTFHHRQPSPQTVQPIKHEGQLQLFE